MCRPELLLAPQARYLPMKANKNSKIIIAILILVIIGILVYYHIRKPLPPSGSASIEQPKNKSITPVTIGKKNIKEENFSGTVEVISGSSPIASSAQKYIDGQVSQFRKQADTDVPPMRQQFGADSPTASYEIDIDATYVVGPKTESIALNVYTYTGGAHGSSFYKVFTASLADGKLLDLSAVIRSEKQADFTEFVKKQLIAWRPEGTNAPVVFPEDVGSLKFSSFSDWSTDSKNLTLYFAQNEIGPGALGAVAFPLSLSRISDFLRPGFGI